MAIEPVILVVDDHPAVLRAMKFTLEAAGYCVLEASDGAEALLIMNRQPVSLILADIVMPKMNGYQLYERVRENPRWVAIPFIFLSARTLDSDIRYGKELGVDDYLTKPVHPEDLLAVVRGKLRRAGQLAQQSGRAGPPSAGSGVVTAGALLVDAGQHRAWLRGEELRLSAREFALLDTLARRVNQVVSPQELVKVTHELATDLADAENLLRPLIRSLRRKLGYPVGCMGCIENVRGVGYRLVPPSDE